MGVAVGLDFDNTIVRYDGLFRALALERGLIGPHVGPSKRAVRDALRERPGGEVEWQRIQALAYGPRIVEAEPAAGVIEFIKRCRAERVPVYVVSHKTEFARRDNGRVNLRAAALEWLRTNGFFAAAGGLLARERVFFESSRADKIARIEALGLTHFIDDLEETFLTDGFPEGVTRILFDPLHEARPPAGVEVVGSFEEVGRHVFGRSN